MLKNIEQESGESEGTEQGSDSNNNSADEIQIEFEDESGNQKVIIIKVK